MGVIVLAFAAVSLVVVAIQFSCFFASQMPKKEVAVPSNACTES